MEKRNEKFFRITVNLTEEVSVQLNKISKQVKKEAVFREALELHMNRDKNLENIQNMLYSLNDLILILIIIKKDFSDEEGKLFTVLTYLEKAKYNLLFIKRRYSLRD